MTPLSNDQKSLLDAIEDAGHVGNTSTLVPPLTSTPIMAPVTEPVGDYDLNKALALSREDLG